MENLEINVIPKFIDKAMSPVAESVGTTIAALWKITFGGIDIYAEKKHVERVNSLNQFKKELESKISDIPVDKLLEPKLHIVGPSIEASKYYFENEELRSMFSNLIAASLNIDTSEKSHPAFVEIIKQLSPLDANNLSLFKAGRALPIAEYRLILENNGGYSVLKTHVFLENPHIDNIDLIASSMSNLLRLGLISIKYTEQLKAVGSYDKLENYPFFVNIKNILKNNIEVPIPMFIGCIDITSQNGLVKVTPLGRDFISICL